MNNILRTAFARASRAEVESDNDPVTIGHADANTLFAALLRARDDLFRARHAVTEAVAEAKIAEREFQAASDAMQQLFVDHDLIELPLPGAVPMEAAHG
jgi:hypothetical protein